MLNVKTASSRRVQGILCFVGAVALAVPVLTAVGCLPESGDDALPERTASPDQEALASIQRYPHKPLCGKVGPGYRRCHAHVRTLADGETVQSSTTPQGFVPSDLVSAYGIPQGGTGSTVALIDSNDDPNAEADLAVYRAQFGLPACTTANGCFRKVNQSGEASPLPTADSGWAGEISLDLDMVSAACPNCKIILVEATSATSDDLGAAVNTAAAMGATAISNSYGGSEDSTVASADTEYYDHPGILITASAGDEGYGAEYPASGAYVLGVGGTSLAKSTSPRGWAEEAWSDGGSGCSAYIAKPSFQKDTGCAKRTVADVSAIADPDTGVAVYDTYGGSKAGATGWIVVGGTSVASPLVASIFVVSGKGGVANGWPYTNTGDFYDVTTGSNGTCSSSASYLCTAGAGYDGPTGWGTPNAATFGGGSGSSSSSSSSTSSTSTSTSTSTSSTSTSSSSSGKSSSSSSGTTSSGTSSTSTSTSSTSTSTSTSSGGTTCEHPICSTGEDLDPSCDPCAKKVCATDPYCCDTLWDSVCVGEVGSICGESCGGGGTGSSSSSSSSTSTSSSGGTCSHPLCDTGSKLKTGCNACVAELCAEDSFCCADKWDSVCVSEVTSICGETCP